MDSPKPYNLNSAFLTPPTTPNVPGPSGGGRNGNTTNTNSTNNGGSSPTPSAASSSSSSGTSTSKGGPRLIVDFSDLTVPVPTTPRSLQPEELRRLFLVSLEKMFTEEPACVPFRQPVDPEALGLPDYRDIIRKPMDLQTIRIKMNCLKYPDPWMYVDDVLLMFDNAWVYNRPTSRVYQYCSKLSEVFQKEINPVMFRLGYKHGRIHQFNSQTLSCFGRPVCLIQRNDTYYNFLRFHLCEKCFNANLNEEGVKLPWQNNVIVSKEHFVQLSNDLENSYSPAAEMHRAYKRDAEMSRQLVIREFLKMLHSPNTHSDKKRNVRKMLRLNGQLRSEFSRYFDQQRERGLLTPGEVNKVEYHLKIIEEGEDNQDQEDKRKSLLLVEEDLLKDNHDLADDTISTQLVEMRFEAEDNLKEEDNNGNNNKGPSSSSGSGGSALALSTSTTSSNSGLGFGIELEESSSSSNCSTLSSLKSLGIID